MAAKYELETNESIETARHLFQRALRFLPTSRKIWIEVLNWVLIIHFRNICFNIDYFTKVFQNGIALCGGNYEKTRTAWNG